MDGPGEAWNGRLRFWVRDTTSVLRVEWDGKMIPSDSCWHAGPRENNYFPSVRLACKVQFPC